MILFAIVCTVSTLFGNINEEEIIFRNFFMILCYVNLASNILFWHNNRSKSEKILSDMTELAVVLEKWSNNPQQQRLIMISNKAKFMVNYYHFLEVSVILFFSVYPAMSKTLGVTLSILPNTELCFWVLFGIETPLVVVGCVASYDLYAYHLQTTLCLYGLLKNISEHFLTVDNSDHLNQLIQKHGALLDITSGLRILCSKWCFLQISVLLTVLIINTFTCIRGTRDPGILLVIPLCLVFACTFCFLGESWVIASEEIGLSVYRQNWLKASPDFRRKLVMVIARCQTPEFLDAGLIGSLSLPTFTKILRLWFKFVQALINLL